MDDIFAEVEGYSTLSDYDFWNELEDEPEKDEQKDSHEKSEILDDVNSLIQLYDLEAKQADDEDDESEHVVDDPEDIEEENVVSHEKFNKKKIGNRLD